MTSNIRKASPKAEIQGIAFPQELVRQLKVMAGTLDIQALQHEADAQEFDRKKAESKKLGLVAKRWTSQQAESIRAEVAGLQDFNNYERWKRLATTTQISKKAGEISEKAITDACVDRFNSELKNLGAKQIRVELVKTRIERGRVKRRIQLRGAVARGADPDNVLSDDERSVVTLAAFLADVIGKPFISPSAAAAVVNGRPANGTIEWKLPDGRTFKECEAEKLEQEEVAE